MTHLFLDDERSPSDVYWVKLEDVLWAVVRNYDEFVHHIQTQGMPSTISFDHDLGQEKTGMDCAHFVVSYCLENNIKAPRFGVHSKNVVGKANIEGLLNNFTNHQLRDLELPTQPKIK